MSMLPGYKICRKCGRKYSWNPDIGKIFCPYCTGKDQKKKGPEEMFQRSKGKINPSGLYNSAEHESL